MKQIHGRLGCYLSQKLTSLRRISKKENLNHTVFTRVLKSERNTKRYVKVLEETFRLPIHKIRYYYNSDRKLGKLDRDTKIKLINEMQGGNA